MVLAGLILALLAPRAAHAIVATAVQVPLTFPPSDEAAVHVGEVDAGAAEEPGEYKYGVRATDDSTGRVLNDDDPYIIVRRRSW